MYDWQQYVDRDSRTGRVVDFFTPGAKYGPDSHRGLRRSFEYGGFAWDHRDESHAPIYIYEQQGQPVAWFSEETLVGYVTGEDGLHPPEEIIG